MADERRPYAPVILRNELELKVAPELLEDDLALRSLIRAQVAELLDDAQVARMAADVKAQAEAFLELDQDVDTLLERTRPEPGPRMGTWDAET